MPWHHHGEGQDARAEPGARWDLCLRCKETMTPGKAELRLLEVVVKVGLLPGSNYVEKTAQVEPRIFSREYKQDPRRAAAPFLPRGSPECLLLEVPSLGGEDGGGEP